MGDKDVYLFEIDGGPACYIKDATAPGSKGLPPQPGRIPAGSKVVDPASVGVTFVPEGMVVVQSPDGKLLLAPNSIVDTYTGQLKRLPGEGLFPVFGATNQVQNMMQPNSSN